jgi:hypothetical protein
LPLVFLGSVLVPVSVPATTVSLGLSVISTSTLRWLSGFSVSTCGRNESVVFARLDPASDDEKSALELFQCT